MRHIGSVNDSEGRGERHGLGHGAREADYELTYFRLVHLLSTGCLPQALRHQKAKVSNRLGEFQ